MFGRKTAKRLDAAAAALHEAGRKAGGDRGGRVGDAIANAVLGGLRNKCAAGCTRPDCDSTCYRG